ncbi:MAG: hypothetical protein K8S54_06305 [Spirochaetia bacterium]|nr:hypothetical protein [Spirochaetia bacterium]
MWRFLCLLLLAALNCAYRSDCISTDGACQPLVTYVLFQNAGINLSSPAGNPTATTPSSVSGLIFLFRTTTTSTGLLGGVGGRGGADVLCAGSRGSYVFPDNSCSSTRAFISINGTDEISDMPTNYGVPSGNSIQGQTGTEIAADWTALLSGSISVSLSTASVLPAATAWASYSTSSGTLAGNNCTNGTVTGLNGQVGTSGSTNATWMDNGTSLCIAPTYLLCLCY